MAGCGAHVEGVLVEGVLEEEIESDRRRFPEPLFQALHLWGQHGQLCAAVPNDSETMG